VVSHAPALIDALQAPASAKATAGKLPECHSIPLEKRFGETVLAVDDERTVAWRWPAR
jgi:hypothetical protein